MEELDLYYANKGRRDKEFPTMNVECNRTMQKAANITGDDYVFVGITSDLDDSFKKDKKLYVREVAEGNRRDAINRLTKETNGTVADFQGAIFEISHGGHFGTTELVHLTTLEWNRGIHWDAGAFLFFLCFF